MEAYIYHAEYKRFKVWCEKEFTISKEMDEIVSISVLSLHQPKGVGWENNKS